jgi:cytidylate kinase
MAVVTISRDLGSGGREVGKILAEGTGYRFLDHAGILAAIKAEGNKGQKWIEGLDERSPRLWEKYDWSYRASISLMQSTILDAAAAGKVIIIGRGGNYLLEGISFVLRVRVVAPPDVRIARVAERESIDPDSARWLVGKTDRERAGFLHAVYGRNGTDPADYDVVFDAGTMPLDQIVVSIKALLTEKDRLQEESSLRVLQMKALAAKVKAHLLAVLPFFMPTLDVDSDEKSIRIWGIVRLPRERELVEKEAKMAAGGTPIRFELRYRQ